MIYNHAFYMYYFYMKIFSYVVSLNKASLIFYHYTMKIITNSNTQKLIFIIRISF